MNNEILEISQWLHEKGFTPDQWTGTEGHIFFTNGPGTLLIYKALEDDGEELEGTVSDNYTPYFTLGQALELLPYTIESFDLEFSKRREYLAYVKHVSDSEIYYHKCQVTWIRKREIDYHLAALRLLKRTVEEGYVKTN